MINLENNKIMIGTNIDSDITGFEVWFVVPEGLCCTREEALEDAKRLNYNPELIKPVPVAVVRAEKGTLLNYEVFVR